VGADGFHGGGMGGGGLGGSFRPNSYNSISLASLHGDHMRHSLAGFFNWAAPLVATLSVVFTVLVPSPSNVAPNISSGHEPSEVASSARSRGSEWKVITPSGLPTNQSDSQDPVFVQPNMSSVGEPNEGSPRHSGSTPASATNASSDPEQSDAAAAGAPPNAQECGSTEFTTYSNLGHSDSTCGGAWRTLPEIAEARAYLLETASPGYTMTLQGPEVAISRLHPEFAVRLESAIREARNSGLPFAGVFSAYRPPVFGVGGFSDKFHSLHTYGLAVDMRGIGRPGSPEAQLWHQIAANNGVVCPYGPLHRAEWNHCQPTSIKIILADNPLRDTVNAAGPYDLESMFEAGKTIIEDVASAAAWLSKATPTPVSALETSATGREPMPQVMASRGTKRRTIVRLALGRSADKPMRHPKESAGIGVGGPIIAIEAGQRTSSVRQAKHGTRVLGLSKITILEKRERTPFSAKKAKHDMRVGVRNAPVIAESRRKSKSGRG
jgi:hypothetical protein